MDLTPDEKRRIYLEEKERLEAQQRVQAELNEQQAKPTSSDKFEGVASGCLFGLLGSAVLFVIGGLLCLTGIGAILGIPMILAALAFPFFAPAMGAKAVRGKCPHCGKELRGVQVKPIRSRCHVCLKDIEYRNGKFYKAT